MSRIGNQPVALPKGVSFSLTGGEMLVKGPKGSLTRKTVDGVSFKQVDDSVVIERAGDTPQLKAYHGLMRSLLNNMVIGVSNGFTRNLEIIGVGYKAEVKGNKLVLNLGYSHQVEFPFPAGVKVEVEKNTKLTVSGIDKEAVGQAAAEIRGFRPPDSYKGKGVRYEGEHIRIKAGKSGQ